MKVRDPDGQVWRVSRRWVPWRRRLRGHLGDAIDVMPDGLGDDPISAIIFVVCLVIALPFLVVAFVAGLELLLVLLLLPFAILGRVAFGRHWTVEVRKGWRPWWEDGAGDWQASGIRIHEEARRIEAGQVPYQSLYFDKAERRA